MQDDGVWFEIIESLTPDEREAASKVLPFPPEDERGQNVLLYPEQYRKVDDGLK